MSEGKLVVVFSAANEVQALLYRSVLEEAGIDVMERQYETFILESVKQRALHSELLVREEDADKARELVDAFHQEAERGELAVDSPEEQG